MRDSTVMPAVRHAARRPIKVLPSVVLSLDTAIGAGTSKAARSLPPSSAGAELRSFAVAKPFEVEVGPAAPWFGETGWGTLYGKPIQLQIPIEHGLLTEATL